MSDTAVLGICKNGELVDGSLDQFGECATLMCCLELGIASNVTPVNEDVGHGGLLCSFSAFQVVHDGSFVSAFIEIVDDHLLAF